MKKKKKIILGSAITSAVAIPTVAVASILAVKHHKESDGDQKVATDSSKESLLKTIQGMELDDNEKVQAIFGAQNKGEIAYSQAIAKLADLKQETLKENISVQELQKIKEKILQVIQDAKNANAQQQSANVIATGLPFEKLPQNVKDFYESKGVTATTVSIGNSAFVGSTLPDGFTIPNSITSIEDYAFQTATFPVGFTIPSSVTSIGEFVFSSATLPKGFTIPSSVTSIGIGTFYGVTLSDGFTIPSSVTSIGSYAFYGATLSDGFTIPSSVTSIDGTTFTVAKLPDGTSIQNPPQLNGNALTLNSNGTWS